MMDFLFFVKTLILCLVITLAMQVKFDEFTLEEHAQSFIANSMLVEPIQNIAHGGAKLLRDLSHKVYGSMRKNVKDKGNADRTSSFKKSSDFSDPSQYETDVD